MSTSPVSIIWLRRDLRLHDHAAIHAAIQAGLPVQLVFIFDTEILDRLENKNDARLLFIHQTLTAMDRQLREYGGGIRTYYGSPLKVWETITNDFQVKEVFAANDYEPYAIARDTAVALTLKKQGITFTRVKDQVIFEQHEVVKDDGTPYTVFTPYGKKWRAALAPQHVAPRSTQRLKSLLHQQKLPPIHTLKSIGFSDFDFSFAAPRTDKKTLDTYKANRDFPAADATSRISMHLRFGTVSIREQVQKALKAKNDSWLNELIWREFYMMILWHFPQVIHQSFKPQYDRIEWRNNAEEFARWCEGTTGYPIVDAGMRELNSTGFMHNRLRMIVASFLTKHLLIDWRWGEAYFASRLLDFELSSNNGGWQWAAGCGCDAAPYFRIFNPAEQTRKFDPELRYIRKWVPEFESLEYPTPIVDHRFARERCLKTYKKVTERD